MHASFFNASLTPEKRLWSGRPVWRETAHSPINAHVLKKALKCDVAIIGAGISGAFMAHALAGTQDSVVVLDRRAPATGSTFASTALLQYEIDTPLTELGERIGNAKAARAWQLSRRMTRKLMQLVRDEGIHCGLEDRASLYLAGSEIGARGLTKEARARARAGLPCDFLTAGELRGHYGIRRTGAIFSKGHAVADPVALTHGLLRGAKRRGAELYAPCEVKGVLAGRQGVVLDAGDHFVEAKTAIFCTGYETVRGLPKSGTRIISSWAAATAPNARIPEWLSRTLLWEASDPYIYIRTDGAGRLIVGGEDAERDSAAYRSETLVRKARVLARKTHALLPEVTPHWTHVWAGAFGDSADGLPIIDAVPGLPHCFAVLSFGGNGTIYSMLAAHLMPSLLRGRPLKDAPLFRFR